MSRYERITELSECKLGKECPIFMQKGVILKDTITDKYFLQLKLSNASENVIQNVYAKLQCSDLTGSEEHNINVTYLKLNCASNNSFGTQTLIALPQMYNKLKFNEIVVEYQNGEKEVFDSTYFLKLPKIEEKKNLEYLPVFTAVVLLIGEVLRFINSYDDIGIEQCITLLLIIALLFRKKNGWLAINIGIRVVYDMFMIIAWFIYYSKIVEYGYGDFSVFNIASNIIYRSSYVILLVLLIITLVTSSSKLKNVIKKLWGLPGILHLVGLGMIEVYHITIYSNYNFVYSILQSMIAIFAMFLMGYWITHEVKK